MINKFFKSYFNKTVSIILLSIFLFGLIPVMAFGQPASVMPSDVKGFN